jgi:D-alanyl-D-alanine carboxypeptidase
MTNSNFVRARRVAAARPTLIVAALVAGVALSLAATLGAIGLVVNVGPPVPAGLPECSVAQEPVDRGTYEDWASTLVDPSHTLGRDYRPPDLRRDFVGGELVKLRDFVFGPLTDLIAAAAADGVTLSVTSSYRSYEFQEQLFADNPGKDDLIALPGHSEHQLGTTVDLSGGDEWLAQNAARFGFVLSFPSDRSPRFTCYSSEPWHYRYFGTDRARAIAASDLSPREWLWAHDPPARAI